MGMCFATCRSMAAARWHQHTRCVCIQGLLDERVTYDHSFLFLFLLSTTTDCLAEPCRADRPPVGLGDLCFPRWPPDPTSPDPLPVHGRAWVSACWSNGASNVGWSHKVVNGSRVGLITDICSGPSRRPASHCTTNPATGGFSGRWIISDRLRSSSKPRRALLCMYSA